MRWPKLSLRGKIMGTIIIVTAVVVALGAWKASDQIRAAEGTGQYLKRDLNRELDLGSERGTAELSVVKVLASDIDPLSVVTARDNARLNGAGGLVETIRATGFSAPQFARACPFDLVLANILANPLRQMATPMTRHLAPSAQVILSGLLPHQAQSVIAAYRARGLVLERHIEIEGWSSLLLRNAR